MSYSCPSPGSFKSWGIRIIQIPTYKSLNMADTSDTSIIWEPQKLSLVGDDDDNDNDDDGHHHHHCRCSRCFVVVADGGILRCHSFTTDGNVVVVFTIVFAAPSLSTSSQHNGVSSPSSRGGVTCECVRIPKCQLRPPACHGGGVGRGGGSSPPAADPSLQERRQRQHRDGGGTTTARRTTITAATTCSSIGNYNEVCRHIKNHRHQR